jgi:hypothetical protein
MKCILCGKHLYQEMNFSVLISNKNIHQTCENAFILHEERVTFPIENGIVEYDYLFSRGTKKANIDQLFFRYMGIWLSRFIKDNSGALLILYDDVLEGDLSLILSLGSYVVVLLSMFDEIEL